MKLMRVDSRSEFCFSDQSSHTFAKSRQITAYASIWQVGDARIQFLFRFRRTTHRIAVKTTLKQGVVGTEGYFLRRSRRSCCVFSDNTEFQQPNHTQCHAVFSVFPTQNPCISTFLSGYGAAGSQRETLGAAV